MVAAAVLPCNMLGLKSQGLINMADIHNVAITLLDQVLRPTNLITQGINIYVNSRDNPQPDEFRQLLELFKQLQQIYRDAPLLHVIHTRIRISNIATDEVKFNEVLNLRLISGMIKVAGNMLELTEIPSRSSYGLTWQLHFNRIEAPIVVDDDYENTKNSLTILPERTTFTYDMEYAKSLITIPNKSLKYEIAEWLDNLKIAAVGIPNSYFPK